MMCWMPPLVLMQMQMRRLGGWSWRLQCRRQSRTRPLPEPWRLAVADGGEIQPMTHR